MAFTAKAQPLGLATLDASGIVPDAQLPAGLGDFAQGAAVADQGALTASAAAALTASAPAALTATAAAGATPTDDEYDALLADVTALRTTVAAVVVDIAAIRTATNAAIVDVASTRTKVNALLASLRTANLIDT